MVCLDCTTVMAVTVTLVMVGTLLVKATAGKASQK